MRSLSLAALALCVSLSFGQEVTSPQELVELREVRPFPASRLRVTNRGEEDIEDFVVLFPSAEIEFGDVPGGATTPYTEVPGGVYSYAAYRLRLHGQVITQPVIDWFGAVPMEGASFTYNVELYPGESPPVRLIEVTRDD